MANNTKNRTKRESTDVSPKSKIGRKELTKRVKVNKSPIKGSIAMSQQLKRKTAQHNEISKLCTIVKPMPSLKDLEKMYEDSDEEDNVVPVRSPTQLQSTIPEPSANIGNELLEGTMQENVCNPIEDCLSPTNNIDIDTYNDLPDVLLATEQSPNISTTTQEYPNIEETKSCWKDLGTCDNTKITTKLTPIEEHNDCNSSDSNKTVDYNLSSSIIFCPLPSTSNDKNTIIKNDELFYESLKNASFRNNDSIISDSNLETESRRNLNNQDIVDTDDDCIIINDSTDSTEQRYNIKYKKIVTEPINIDDSINMDKSIVALDEPIDIDALIADNQCMLTKYQNSKNSGNANNSVEDVYLDCQQFNRAEQFKRRIATSENEVVQNQNNSQEVLFVSETLPNKSRKIGDIHSLYNQEPVYYGPDGVPIDTQNQTEVGNYLLREVQGFLDRYKQHMRETENMSPPLSFINSSTNFMSDLRSSSPIPQPEMSSSIIEISDTPPTNTNAQENSGNNKRKRKKSKSTTILTSNSISSYTPSPTRNLGDCPICMDTFSGKILASTICGHVFCMPCLEMSIRTSKRCPACRKILKNRSSYHQIFL